MNTPPAAALEASDLCIGYRQGKAERTVADGLDLKLEAGRFVCLLGPNGTGKSTLIRTLGGMQKPLAGQLWIGGADYAGIPPRQRARLVSLVLTDSLPAGMMDAYSMVALGRHPYSGWFGGLSEADHSRIEWALAAVGARPLAGRQVSELSDGERQKIAIARALAQQTEVLLLDEPTAFLDLPRRVELMRLLRDLAHRERLALLLSTHDLDLALRFADQLWLLDSAGSLLRGYPESIGLSGDFASVFASESLDWDPASGSFRAHPTPCLAASLEGSGPAALWTRRALERLGFEVVEPGAVAVFQVEVPGADRWTVQRGERSEAFNRLDGLIDWVLNEDWAQPQP